MLDVWMWRRPTLGHGRVELGGGKLLAVTHRNPGLHAERKIERWEAARSGRKRAAVASWMRRKVEAIDLGVCSELRWLEPAVRQGGSVLLGAWKGHLRPRSDRQFSGSREAFLQQAPGARGGVKVLAPRSDGMGVETWKEE